MVRMNVGKLTCCALALTGLIRAQGAITIKLEDALARARQYGGQIQTANSAVLRDTTITRAPAAASSSAASRPIPRPPPVTNATRPFIAQLLQ